MHYNVCLHVLIYLCILYCSHNCIAISVHPGTTDTDLSIPFQKNVAADKLFPVEKSVAMLLDVIWATDMNSTGKFFAYDGKEIPW